MSSANGSRQIEFSVSTEHFNQHFGDAVNAGLRAMGFAHNHKQWLLSVKGFNGFIPLVLTEHGSEEPIKKVKKGIKAKVYGKS